MKIKMIQVGLLLLSLITCVRNKVIAQQKKINIQVVGTGNQLTFAAVQIRNAASENGFAIADQSYSRPEGTEPIVVKMFADSTASLKVSESEHFDRPRKTGWQ